MRETISKVEVVLRVREDTRGAVEEFYYGERDN